MDRIIRIFFSLAMLVGIVGIVTALAFVAWPQRLHWLWHMVRAIGHTLIKQIGSWF